MKSSYKSLLKKRNVIGYGAGKKVSEGKQTKEDCITILVEKKLPMAQLKPKDLVPKKLGGKRTDVIEIGKIKAQVQPPEFHRKKFRPALGGVSLGHEDITAGTFGCVVYDGQTNEPLILSNNHVIANTNKAKVGDDILQPAPFDGGKFMDKIGVLHRFVPIRLDRNDAPTCSIANFFLNLVNALTQLFKPNYKWSVSKQEVTANKVDAAVCEPLSDTLISEDILDVGKVKGITAAKIGQEVKKSGRTTGFTTGTVQVLDATVTVNYDDNSAVFEGQIITTPMSQGGDSGSLVLDTKNKAVGLLFAGSPQSTIINPISDVLEQLNVYFK